MLKSASPDRRIHGLDRKSLHAFAVLILYAYVPSFVDRIEFSLYAIASYVISNDVQCALTRMRLVKATKSLHFATLGAE
jgi:hypothetical protein